MLIEQNIEIIDVIFGTRIKALSFPENVAIEEGNLLGQNNAIQG